MYSVERKQLGKSKKNKKINNNHCGILTEEEIALRREQIKQRREAFLAGKLDVKSKD